MACINPNSSDEFIDPGSDSPGSSVSTRLQEEYDELLRYAVVVPNYNNERSVPPDTGNPQEDIPFLQVLENHGRARERNCEYDASRNPGDDTTESEVENIENYSSVDSEPCDTTPRNHSPTLNEDISLQVRVTGRETQLGAGGPVDDDSTCSDQGYSLDVDSDTQRMEHLMDQWTLDLKRNVMAEFGQSKIRMLERYKQQMIRETERHNAEKSRLQNDLESMKEMLHRYERSVERKDKVIANLTKGLQKLKEKNELMRSFSDWKISHNDSKRANFASKLAGKHHQTGVMRKSWDAWKSLIGNKWKARVEKACQAKAQEVCVGLTNEYESQISALNFALDSAREELAQLKRDREAYEEAMKKSFMRGVCALNMEAMSMFNEADGKGMPQGEEIDNLVPHAHLIPGEAPVFSSQPPVTQLPRVIHHTTPATCTLPSTVHVKCTTSGKRSKSAAPKVSSRVDSGRGKGCGPNTLAPPMSSVVVERHQPVVKQTVGQATASQYPSNCIQPVASGSQKQTTGLSHIHRIKVVD